jgi:hypothetical protein
MMKQLPLEHVRRVAPIPDPMIVKSFVLGTSIGDDQFAVPAGTRMVSPLAAALTQSLTSVRLALAAVRVGLDPEHAAAAGRAYAQMRSAKNVVAAILPQS